MPTSITSIDLSSSKASDRTDRAMPSLLSSERARRPSSTCCSAEPAGCPDSASGASSTLSWRSPLGAGNSAGAA
jgi:hypothetical protein